MGIDEAELELARRGRLEWIDDDGDVLIRPAVVNVLALRQG